jgi:hypothetical protein
LGIYEVLLGQHGSHLPCAQAQFESQK